MSTGVQNARLSVRYVAMDVLLLFSACVEGMFTEPLPRNGHMRHNIFVWINYPYICLRNSSAHSEDFCVFVLFYVDFSTAGK
jgi:hypothetical protein